MKKLISVLLVLVMVLSLSVSAFAAGETGTPEDVDLAEDGEVKPVTKEFSPEFALTGGVTYVTDPVYCLEITWSYEYDDGASLEETKYVWDTEQLKYVENPDDDSSSIYLPLVTAHIALKNKSNVPLEANCSWTAYDKADFTIVSEVSNDGDENNTFHVENLTAAAYTNADEVGDNAYDNYIDTTKTAEREDGKLVFKASENFGYNHQIGDQYAKDKQNADGGWGRTITVGPKSDVDYTGEYEKKLGTYTVTISLPSDD